MIILQLLALLALVPFTAILLLIFNVYLKHWLYLLAIILLGLGYAALCGLALHSSSVTAGVFIVLSILYISRMRSLGKRLKSTDSYPLVRGSFSSKKPKLKLCFYIPLSCLNIFKWLPQWITKEINQDLGLGVEISSLIDQLIGQSRGTLIEVNSEDLSLVLEVQ